MLYMIPPWLLLALLHVYLWRRLIRDPRLPALWRGLATSLLLVLPAIAPVMFITRHLLAHSVPAPVKMIGLAWFGVVAYLAALLIARDLARAAVRGVARIARLSHGSRSSVAGATAAPVDNDPALETRRVFMARAAASSTLVAATGIGAWGMRAALWDITRPEVPVALARLPRALDGFTIALLTDIHIGPSLDGRFLRHLVELTNAARPDLVAIGGDLVDGSVARIGSQVAELRRLRARHGVCFVTGNHEYYSGSDEWIAFLQQLGLRVLMNERVVIGDASPGGAQFDLAGIPDHRAGHFGGLAADARAATAGRDEERELVMLAHQPVQIAETSRVGAGLQLSGHTHGGQLYPFGAVALFAQPYLAGLHHHPASNTQVYVSRGTGFWGPPMRVFAPAEIALIRLQRA